VFNLKTGGEVMEKVTTVGVDLAKNVFSLHGVDAAGHSSGVPPGERQLCN
jgi:hypothetical protein